MASTSEIVAMIDRELSWWDRKAKEMPDQRYVLALAVAIGASKALTDLRDKIASLSTPTDGEKR